MKRTSKLLCILLCMLLIAGCGNSKVEEAKECIDSIYNSYDQIDRAEEKLLSETDAGDIEDLEREIRIYNKFIELDTERLTDIYSELSDKKREEVDDYLSYVAGQRILDIWLD